MNETNNTPQTEQQFQCTGDCLKCLAVQRQYCACQHAYNTMRMMTAMQTSLASMAGQLEELKTKLQAIQGNEALLFSPTTQDDTSSISPETSPTPLSPSSPSSPSTPSSPSSPSSPSTP